MIKRSGDEEVEERIRVFKKSVKSSHSRVWVCVCRGFINLECMMRVVIQQDVAPPSLILSDVIKIKLHSWKHLLRLLGEKKKE